MRTKDLLKIFAAGVVFIALAMLIASTAKNGRAPGNVLPFILLYITGSVCTAGSIADILAIKLYSALTGAAPEAAARKKMFSVMAAAGMPLIALGAYFCIIKAGIPYQDPTPQMQEYWQYYYDLGCKLIFCGGFLFSGGAVGLISVLYDKTR